MIPSIQDIQQSNNYVKALRLVDSEKNIIQNIYSTQLTNTNVGYYKYA